MINSLLKQNRQGFKLIKTGQPQERAASANTLREAGQKGATQEAAGRLHEKFQDVFC